MYFIHAGPHITCLCITMNIHYCSINLYTFGTTINNVIYKALKCLINLVCIAMYVAIAYMQGTYTCSFQTEIIIIYSTRTVT